MRDCRNKARFITRLSEWNHSPFPYHLCYKFHSIFAHVRTFRPGLDSRFIVRIISPDDPILYLGGQLCPQSGSGSNSGGHFIPLCMRSLEAGPQVNGPSLMCVHRCYTCSGFSNLQAQLWLNWLTMLQVHDLQGRPFSHLHAVSPSILPVVHALGGLKLDPCWVMFQRWSQLWCHSAVKWLDPRISD